MALSRRRTLAAVAVVVVLLVGVAAYGLLFVDRPRVQAVDNEWGTVDADRTEIETEVAVANPLLLRVVDGAATLEYAVTMNDVQFATSEKERVHLGGQRDVVTTSTWVNNDQIPAWWVTHVNNDETTNVTVDPTVAVEYVGVTLPAKSWTRERTFQTDLLAPLDVDEPRRFSAFDRTVVVVNETDARWGHATAEQTPINATATVTNELPVPLPITDVQYTIQMNGVVVGEGEAAQQTLIPAGATRTLDARAVVDNSRLDDWWVTHIRNEETTNLTVTFDATVEVGGVERRLPLRFISFERTFETDVFGAETVGGDSDARNATAESAAEPAVLPELSPAA